MTIKETTKKLQQLIDDCPKDGTVVIPKGSYEIGSLFLKSNMTLILAKDCQLLGSKNLADYPKIASRIAGIKMTWPAALINLIDCKNVTIKGDGEINGQGRIWWEKYWGKDQKSGMMDEYSKKGLRWIVDYDCERPRNILVQKCQKIQLENFHSFDSGFWNLQIVWSKEVLVNHLTIKNGKGPSTDGIDVDSSENVVIENCYVECNDDNICIKSGRGKEAFLDNQPTKKVTVRNCELGVGSGITLGSEVSGGIEEILIENNTFNDTGVGFRIKSSRNRGGYIKNITVKNLIMENVHFAVKFDLDWFPAYSYGEGEKDVSSLPVHWQKVIDDVKGSDGITLVSDILIDGIISKKDPEKFSRALYFGGQKEKPIKNLTLKNLNLTATEFGEIHSVENLKLTDIVLNVEEKTMDERGSYAR